jgi:hypothetical protein
MVEYFNFKSWSTHLGSTPDFWRSSCFAGHLKHSFEGNSRGWLVHKVDLCLANSPQFMFREGLKFESSLAGQKGFIVRQYRHLNDFMGTDCLGYLQD